MMMNSYCGSENYTTVSGTEGLEMVCVALQEFTVTCNVSGDNC